MHQTSEIYKALLERYQEGRGDVRYENRLAIGERGALADHQGRRILFGGTAIRVNFGSPGSAFREDMLLEDGMITTLNVFPGSTPGVGGCVCGEIDVEMRLPAAKIPKRARLIPYVRLTDGVQTSEWIQKGVFYADTREEDPGKTISTLTIHGYDAMLRAEADYPGESKLAWPAKDIDVVREIATAMGVGVDSRTVDALKKGYKIQLPTGYSQREVLGYIAASYAGNFVISDLGELLFIFTTG